MLLSELGFPGDHKTSYWNIRTVHGVRILLPLREGAHHNGNVAPIGWYIIEHASTGRAWRDLDALTAQAVIFHLLENKPTDETHELPSEVTITPPS
jgi:hypothetical protein